MFKNVLDEENKSSRCQSGFEFLIRRSNFSSGAIKKLFPSFKKISSVLISITVRNVKFLFVKEEQRIKDSISCQSVEINPKMNLDQ